MLLGEAMLGVVEAGRFAPRSTWSKNSAVITAGAVLAHAAFPGGSLPGVNAMYIEFQNVAELGDPATVPEVDPEDLSYYQALAVATDRDYLRVPLLPASEFSVAPGNELLLPTGVTDWAWVTAVTGATEGVNGKPFTAAALSVVCGIAAVSVPNWDDPTQDVLFARAYYEPSNQLARSAAVEIAARYRWRLTPT